MPQGCGEIDPLAGSHDREHNVVAHTGRGSDLFDAVPSVEETEDLLPPLSLGPPLALRDPPQFFEFVVRHAAGMMVGTSVQRERRPAVAHALLSVGDGRRLAARHSAYAPRTSPAATRRRTSRLAPFRDIVLGHPEDE